MSFHHLYLHTLTVTLMVVAELLLARTGEGLNVSTESYYSMNCSAVTASCKWTDGTKRISCNGIADLDTNIFQCVPESARILDLSGSFFGGLIVNFSLQHLNELEELTLNFTRLTHIESEAFHNLSHLTFLELSDNRLTSLPVLLFEPLESLRVLGVSGNRISNLSLVAGRTSTAFQNLTSFLAEDTHIYNFQYGILCESPKLTVVDLTANSIQFDTSTFACSSSGTSARIQGAPMRLILEGNHQKDDTLQDSVFASLDTVYYLDLSACKLHTIQPKALEGLISLKELIMDRNFFLELPEFTGSGAVLVPELTLFSCRYGSLRPESSMVFEGLHKIEQISVIGNAIYFLSLKGNFSLLTSLDIGDNPVQEIYPTAFNGMSNLLLLSLEGNEYDLEVIDENIFSSLASITELRLSGNHLILDDTGSLFQHLCTLQYLELHGTFITHIRKQWFHCMKQLTYLDLSGNKISTWDPETFRGIPLEYLDLHNNHIEFISKAMIAPFLPNVYFIAGQNPFECTCDLRDYISFMNDSNRDSEINWPSDYTCSSPAAYTNRLLADYQPGFVQCSTYFIPVCSGGGFLLLVIGGIVLAYRKRWYIRHWWYLLRIHRTRRRAIKDASKEYAYDAFVSYSSEDQEWVGDMMNRMELDEDSDIRLFVHGRDFRVGRYITDNIVEGVEASRKTVVILSKHYARSEWCKFEMNMAHTKQVEEGRDFLLLILLEPIGEENMTKTLRFLLSSKTYLEWTEDETEQRIFWRRLRHELERPALAPPRERRRGSTRDDDDDLRTDETGTVESEEPNITNFTERTPLIQ